jgi:metal-responsive CopG/Arc/MetJ family transcriptional regulator
VITAEQTAARLRELPSRRFFERQCYHLDMKTIAVSIDEPTLAAVDRLLPPGIKNANRRKASGDPGNRSAVVRRALQEYLARNEKASREERERRILAAHRDRLAREAAALVREQAKT